MGRPLNNRMFGPGPGKLAITFNDGTDVVTGYVVKQTGSKRYIATVDGVTVHEVNLAQTTEAAEDLVAGTATFRVSSGEGYTYITNLQSATAITTDGTAVMWSTDPDAENSLVIETTPSSSTVFDGNLSVGALKDVASNTVFMGSGNFGDHYQIARNGDVGLEIAMKVHKYRSTTQFGTLSTDEGNNALYTLPAGALTNTGGVSRAGWVVDFTLLAGMFDTGTKLSDFQFKLMLDLDSADADGEFTAMVRQSDSSWTIGEATILVIDPNVATLADKTLVDQNSINIGYASLNAYRPQDISADWAAEDGLYSFVLVAEQAGVEVASVRVSVNTSTTATW